MEVTRALAALQPLYGKGNIEIVTVAGHRVRGIVRSSRKTATTSNPMKMIGNQAWSHEVRSG